MSITFPAAYSAQLKNSVIDVDWLFHFKNNNDGYVYLSSKDRTVGTTRYYGIIEDSGEISKDLDLINCKASIGEISISCVDNYRNGKLSAELLHNGTDVYINQQVLIYECINNESTLANCPKLYEGRLKEIDIQGNNIVLVIEQWTPFDHITIPNVKSVRGTYQPVAYGDFEQDVEENFYTSKSVFPCPFYKREANKLYFLTHQAITGTAGLMYYDSKLDKFLPITSAGANTEVVGSVNIANVPTALARTFRFRPTGSAAGQEFNNALASWDSEVNLTGTTTSTSATKLVDSGATFVTDNVAVGHKVINTTDDTETTVAAIDSQTQIEVTDDIFVSGEGYELYIEGTSKESSYAFYPNGGTHTVATAGADVTEEYSLMLKFEEPTGKFTALRIHAQATVTGDYSECVIQPNSSEIDLVNNIYSMGTNLIQVTISEISGAGADYTETRVNVTEDAANNLITDYIAANYVLPPYIELIAKYFADYNAGTGNETISGWVRVHDVYLRGTVSLDFTTEAEAAEKFITDLEYLYCGSDGLDADYTDGPGTPAIEVHQVHRDIMNRFAGVDFDNDYMANWIDASPGAYDLDVARDNWKVRLWLLEPEPLKDVLDKLQFEGCFIFTLTADSDGSGTPGGRYIWVQDTYDADDVIQTLGEADYTDLSIGHTDVFEIITKSTYNFNRHPALNKFIGETSYDNNADQALYNLSDSHFESIDLDYLVNSRSTNNNIYTGSDTVPNSSIALYRDNIQSEPKIMVDCEIVNKSKSNVEYGDIIKFSDTNVLPYGKAWANLWFMVIREARSKHGVSITAREVYRT